jgi:hypothetical protein
MTGLPVLLCPGVIAITERTTLEIRSVENAITTSRYKA